jgi:hypothetical protein
VNGPLGPAASAHVSTTPATASPRGRLQATTGRSARSTATGHGRAAGRGRVVSMSCVVHTAGRAARELDLRRRPQPEWPVRPQPRPARRTRGSPRATPR